MKIDVSDDAAENILKMAYGGKMNMADGGMVEGPSHEEGGVEVQDEDSGEPIAEVEGGERIFSIEDTQMMEETAAQIVEMMNAGQRQEAEDLAMRLGFAVVNMLAAQMESQAAQEEQLVAETGATSSEAEMMNGF